MSTYMHRVSHFNSFSRPLLENHGYLTIGFSDFLREYDLIQRVRKEGEPAIREVMKNTWGDVNQNRWVLFRFLTMEKGDWVVVPGPGTFSVYEIKDDEPQKITDLSEDEIKAKNGIGVKGVDHVFKTNDEKEKQVDLGYIWKVNPIKEGIPRKKYADATLTKKLRYPRTNLEISYAFQSVKDAVEAYEKGKPINLHEIILDKTRNEVYKTINSYLNPNKWEQLIKWYFEKAGASQVEFGSKQKNDAPKGDADVIATFEPLKTVIYVQAKFHNGQSDKHGVEQIQDYVSIKDNEDEDYQSLAWVISSAEEFNDQAKEEARNNGVLLINGEEFTKMVMEVGLGNLGELNG